MMYYCRFFLHANVLKSLLSTVCIDGVIQNKTKRFEAIWFRVWKCCDTLGANAPSVFVSYSRAFTCMGRKKRGKCEFRREGPWWWRWGGWKSWSGNGVGKSNLFFIRCWDGMSYITLSCNFVPAPGSQKMKE